MTQNKRIFWNVVATYARSLYALVIGILCGRWTLMALGKTDYGLMGLVGGLVGFISFFNSILSQSIARYYAVSVGEAQVTGREGLEKCRMWFTTGVVAHTVLPVVLMIAGYPAGIWAIESFLDIPPDRVSDCVWVWRAVCFSCFLGMVTVPINAMYTAKQYIAELTIYAFASTTLNACFLYYMITHPGVWMVPLAFWNCFLALLPTLIISVRAIVIFPECRFRWKYVRCFSNLMDLGGFCVWNTLPSLGCIFRTQGLSILVNKYFGPALNAGMAVGTSLSSHTETLSASLYGAFSPAICNAWGAGRHDFARALALRVGKLGSLLILFFALPLSLEVDEVLRLWLRNPPDCAALFFLYIMAMTVIDKSSYGHSIALNANGDIKWYAIVLSPVVMLAFVIAWVLLFCGVDVNAIGIGLVSSTVLLGAGRLAFARRILGMRVRSWFARVAAPLLITIVSVLAAGLLPRAFLPPSFVRVLATAVVCECVLLPLAWFVVLDGEERSFILVRVKKKFAHG